MAVLICDFGVKDYFLGNFIQKFSYVFEFTESTPLAIDEFLDLCDELAGPFESRFSSHVSDICLLYKFKGFGDET